VTEREFKSAVQYVHEARRTIIELRQFESRQIEAIQCFLAEPVKLLEAYRGRVRFDNPIVLLHDAALGESIPQSARDRINQLKSGLPRITILLEPGSSPQRRLAAPRDKI